MFPPLLAQCENTPLMYYIFFDITPQPRDQFDIISFHFLFVNLLTIFCLFLCLILPPMDFSRRNKVSVCRYRNGKGMVCCCVAHQMPVRLCCACPAFLQPPTHPPFNPSLWLKFVSTTFLSLSPSPSSHCHRAPVLKQCFGYFISYRIKCSMWTLECLKCKSYHCCFLIRVNGSCVIALKILSKLILSLPVKTLVVVFTNYQ